MSVCDFCSSPDVAWAFPCRTLTKEVPVPDVNVDFGSIGSWAACATCHELIVAGKREELAQRSVETMDVPTQLKSDVMLSGIRGLHDTFWSNREGDPVPTTPGAPDPFVTP